MTAATCRNMHESLHDFAEYLESLRVAKMSAIVAVRFVNKHLIDYTDADIINTSYYAISDCIYRKEHPDGKINSRTSREYRKCVKYYQEYLKKKQQEI